MLLLTINGKSYMGFRLVFIHMSLAHSKGQVQGHAYFNSEYLGNEYLGNGDRLHKNYYCYQITSNV